MAFPGLTAAPGGREPLPRSATVALVLGGIAAALVLLLSLLLAGVLLAEVAQSQPPMGVRCELQTRGPYRAGRPGEVRVLVKNRRADGITLRQVLVPQAVLAAAEMAVLEPPARRDPRAIGFIPGTAYALERTLPAGKELAITCRLEARRAGTVRGNLTVTTDVGQVFVPVEVVVEP
jgi:hypothetical protein